MWRKPGDDHPPKKWPEGNLPCRDIHAYGHVQDESASALLFARKAAMRVHRKKKSIRGSLLGAFAGIRPTTVRTDKSIMHHKSI